jgi:hypothetical protein
MSPPPISREEFLNTYITPTTAPPSDFECSICKDEYDTSTNHAAVTFSDKRSCKHVYGQHCIETWLKGDMVNTCCLCRRALFTLPPEEQWGNEHEEGDNYDESGEEEEEEEDYKEWIFDIPDEDISTIIEKWWYNIYNTIAGPPSWGAQIPSHIRITIEFCEYISMGYFDGKRDLKSEMSDDRVEQLDEFWGNMIEDIAKEKVCEFPRRREAGWVADVQKILGIEMEKGANAEIVVVEDSLLWFGEYSCAAIRRQEPDVK